MDSGSVANSIGHPKREGVHLEGWMLKRGSRRRKQWNRRYFTLSENNSFSYYENPADSTPKGSFIIGSESGCQVGGMYIDQRNDGGRKELLYCIKISWSSQNRPEPDSKPMQGAEPGTPGRTLSPYETPVSGSPGTMTPRRNSRTKTASPSQQEQGPPSELVCVDPDMTGSARKKKHRRNKTWASEKKKPPLTATSSRVKNDSGFHSFRSETELLPTQLEYDPIVRSSSDIPIFRERTPVQVSGKKDAKSRSRVLFSRSKERPIGPNEDIECESVVSLPETVRHANMSFRRSWTAESSTKNTPNAKSASVNKKEFELGERADPGGVQTQLGSRSLTAQREQERQLMQSLYEATQKDNRLKTQKKVMTGVKVAAAAGTAITVGVLTAGVGILVGMVVLSAGAAAGGTGVAAGAGLKQTRKRKDESIVLASPDYETARLWKSALDACLVLESAKDTTWGQMFVMEGRNASSALHPTGASIMSFPSLDTDDASASMSRNKFKVDDETKQKFVNPEMRWLPLEGGWTTLLGSGSQGLRIFREESPPIKGRRGSHLSFEGRPCLPLKAQVVLKASPLDSIMCLLSLTRIPSIVDLNTPLAPNSGQRASFRVIETIDDHMDVIHSVSHPLYLFPSWTTPRDFVLLRYWRLEQDGTYCVCLDSVEHSDCPPHPGYTRGEMHSVYMISPLKRQGACWENIHDQESLLTSIVQVDPRGWVPTVSLPMLSSQSYAEAFGVAALLQLLDIRDALDFDRFIPVPLEPEIATERRASDEAELHLSPSMQQMYLEQELRARRTQRMSSLDLSSDDEAEDRFSYDYTYSARESITLLDAERGIAMNPKPLPPEKWAQPDANSFRVRSKLYKRNKKKINAGVSIGRLVAVDVVRVERAIYSGFSAHPTERVKRALERERRLQEKGLKSDMPAFVFIVNIVLPGPPFYHGVFYYAIDDMSTIDGSDGTPSSKLCSKFFFGDCDKFRDETFKLIPQIVEGNFLVRKAVGSTPAIMGTKLRQLYVRSDRFCEVILDCGSSAVASGVIRLSLSYAKTMVVDMGFLFEGNDESTLPERIFGCVRIKKPHFGNHLRLVPQPSAM